MHTNTNKKDNVKIEVYSFKTETVNHEIYLVSQKNKTKNLLKLFVASFEKHIPSAKKRKIRTNIKV